MILRRDTKAMREAKALLAALVLEDGRRIGDVWESWQWALAMWAFDERARPNRWESRPRGGSKSTDIAGISMVAMLTTLAGGSQLDVYAVDRDQARLIVDWARGIVARSPGLASALSIDNYKITSRNGSVLEVLAADAASAYGRKPAIAVLDEFCQWPNTTNARGVWQAVSSSMGKVAGAKLLLASTSGDPGHWSRRIYETAVKSKSWAVQDVAGPLPWASEEFLAEQREILPGSVYTRLHLNQWAAPEDRLTSLDDIRACVTLDGPQDPAPGRRYVIGVDLSQVKDRTACAVMHAERAAGEDGREVVQRYVLDRLEVWQPSRANPIDYNAVEGWIVEAARQYRAQIYGDIYQAVGMAQRIRNQGFPFELVSLSVPTNNKMAVALHTTIRSHRLAIPDDPELIDELAAMRIVETSPNLFKLEHDPDKHNDRGTAIGLALMALATAEPAGARPILYTAEELRDEDSRVALAHARAAGIVPEAVPVIGGRAFGGDFSTGLDREDGDSQENNGRTMKSPFG